MLEIPATALINDAQGLRVALVDGENKLRLVPIAIERNTGATMQVSRPTRAWSSYPAGDMDEGKSYNSASSKPCRAPATPSTMAR